ncbi:MAG: hypothetical protein AAB851_00850 [Patescibacteria group bacterium]
MKELKELNEVRLQDAPNYKETAEMYFSVKSIDTNTGEVDENKTAATIYALIRPLVEAAKNKPEKMMILERAAKTKKHDHTSILAKARFEI